MLRDFFSYQGRIGRKKYFLTFFTVIILSFLFLIGIGIGGIAIVGYVFKIPISDKMLPIVVLPWAVLMWTVFSFPTVKRLHDMEFSGRFFLLLLLHPVYVLFRKIYLNDLRIIEAELLISVIGLVILLVLFLKKGTKESNKYGPDPLKKSNSPNKTQPL